MRIHTSFLRGKTIQKSFIIIMYIEVYEPMSYDYLALLNEYEECALVLFSNCPNGNKHVYHNACFFDRIVTPVRSFFLLIFH